MLSHKVRPTLPRSTPSWKYTHISHLSAPPPVQAKTAKLARSVCSRHGGPGCTSWHTPHSLCHLAMLQIITAGALQWHESCTQWMS